IPGWYRDAISRPSQFGRKRACSQALGHGTAGPLVAGGASHDFCSRPKRFALSPSLLPLTTRGQAARTVAQPLADAATTRRNFLALLGVGTLAAAGGGGLLAGCGKRPGGKGSATNAN